MVYIETMTVKAPISFLTVIKHLKDLLTIPDIKAAILAASASSNPGKVIGSKADGAVHNLLHLWQLSNPAVLLVQKCCDADIAETISAVSLYSTGSNLMSISKQLT